MHFSEKKNLCHDWNISISCFSYFFLLKLELAIMNTIALFAEEEIDDVRQSKTIF